MSTSPRRKVIEAIREQITSGRYTAGSRLPTELELADELAVARGTVRSALRELAETGVVELRRKIGCFVAECNPLQPRQPHRLAAFVVPSMPGRHSMYGRLLEGLEQAAFAANCDLSFFNLAQSSEKALAVVEKLKTRPLAGVIFSPLVVSDYYRVNSEILDLFEANQIPYVTIDTPVARGGIIRGNFVGSDGYHGMRQLVRTLAEQGFRRFGSLRVFGGVYTSDQRYQGVIDELAALGLPFEAAFHQEIADVPLPEQGREKVRRMFHSRPDLPEVLLCTHSILARNAADELARLGFRVPEEITVVGFDAPNDQEPLGFAAMRQPFVEIGRRAMEILLESPPGSIRQEFIPCQLVLNPNVKEAAAPSVITA